jgi:hypothetical protein
MVVVRVRQIESAGSPKLAGPAGAKPRPHCESPAIVVRIFSERTRFAKFIACVSQPIAIFELPEPSAQFRIYTQNYTQNGRRLFEPGGSKRHGGRITQWSWWVNLRRNDTLVRPLGAGDLHAGRGALATGRAARIRGGKIRSAVQNHPSGFPAKHAALSFAAPQYPDWAVDIGRPAAGTNAARRSSIPVR